MDESTTQATTQAEPPSERDAGDPRQRALAVIARISGRAAAEIRRDQDLVADLEIDSPQGLQLLVELEEVLGLEISDEDAARMDTVGDILTYVERHPA